VHGLGDDDPYPHQIPSLSAHSSSVSTLLPVLQLPFLKQTLHSPQTEGLGDGDALGDTLWLDDTVGLEDGLGLGDALNGRCRISAGFFVMVLLMEHCLCIWHFGPSGRHTM